MRQLAKSLAIASCLLAASVVSVMADVRPGAFTLAPMIGYQGFDSKLDLDNSAVYGLALGYNLTRNWAIEFDARFAPTAVDATGGPDVDMLSATVNALYHFRPGSDFVPYLAAGVGGAQYDIDAVGKDQDPIAVWGGGFKYALTDNTDLRVDLRHVIDFRVDDGLNLRKQEDTRHNLSAMVGLNFQFGGAEAVPVKAPRPPAPVVPSPAPVAAPPAPQDSDRDGVLDPADRCPGTAPGVRVDAGGCPADSDGDGVPDHRDACLDTPKGSRVDDQGCPPLVKPVETLVLHILFAVNRDQVTPFHYRELDKAFAFIQEYPGYPVVVEGHTDAQGSSEHNQKLSARRAENVRRALIEKYGVAAGRITARGFGESQPAATNATAFGREQNRRVVISIMP